MISSTTKNVEWAPCPNEVSLHLADNMPPKQLCTAAYILAFTGDKLLMANLDRGIDIPGGHIEFGEDPEDAMRREVTEETGAIIGSAKLICFQKILLHCPKPEGYSYPYPESYQLLYFSTEFQVGDFLTDEDSSGYILVSPHQAKNVPWLEINRDVYDYMLSLATVPGIVSGHDSILYFQR